MSYLEEHRDEIFKKYREYELLCDIASYQNNSGLDLQKVLSHFFKEEIYKCRGNCRDNGRTEKTPLDFFNDEKEIDKALKYINKNKRFYNGTETENLMTYLRKGPLTYTHVVSNFSPRVARDIYFRFSGERERKGLNCLDTSCGFGARMSAVLLSGMNYYGIDPNESLNNKLKECENFYRESGAVEENQICDIRCQGSEIFIPEWVNKMDISFTSPPYFDYELYSDDEYASTSNISDIKEWVSKFVIPTVVNTIEYVKPGGYIMINSSDRITKYELLSIWKRCFELHKDIIEYIETFEIEGKTAPSVKGVKYAEQVIVFRKNKNVNPE